MTPTPVSPRHTWNTSNLGLVIACTSSYSVSCLFFWFYDCYLIFSLIVVYLCYYFLLFSSVCLSVSLVCLCFWFPLSCFLSFFSQSVFFVCLCLFLVLLVSLSVCFSVCLARLNVSFYLSVSLSVSFCVFLVSFVSVSSSVSPSLSLSLSSVCSF